MTKPKANHPFKAHTRVRATSGYGEPKTVEGKARRRLQSALKHNMGCVLLFEEMKVIIAQLPEGWLEKECK